MSVRVSLHEPEFIDAHCSSATYWLKIKAEDDCEIAIFFNGPADMVMMLRAGLDSALEVERKSKGRK